eukprot:1159607-Pelagomonas_calceolata.AAC.3
MPYCHTAFSLLNYARAGLLKSHEGLVDPSSTTNEQNCIQARLPGRVSQLMLGYQHASLKQVIQLLDRCSRPSQRASAWVHAATDLQDHAACWSKADQLPQRYAHPPLRALTVLRAGRMEWMP